ncbi:hypothetical protein RRSWK_00314 [Rhodopirellula sp. SWK7]|nr:hypothetical protein RRSWK_00314 [Rhodopirellula sp. SWK7]
MNGANLVRGQWGAEPDALVRSLAHRTAAQGTVCDELRSGMR